MAIKSVVNPVDDSTITIAEGIVEKITYKEKIDNFGNTHSAGLLVDGNWINIALKTKEGYQPQVRFAKGQPGKQTWETLNEGDTVKIVVKPNEWNGKTYYSTTSSKINVTKKGEGQPAQQRAPQGSQNASSSFKKDSIGVLQGHALKGAGMLVARDIFDKDDILSAAKFYHHITKNVKEWYTENSEGLSEYDIGNGAGNAVNTAAQYAGMDEIEGEAIKILQLLPKLSEFIKNGPEAVKEGNKPVQKPKPQPKPVEQEPDFDDFSDDVPF